MVYLLMSPEAMYLWKWIYLSKSYHLIKVLICLILLLSIASANTAYWFRWSTVVWGSDNICFCSTIHGFLIVLIHKKKDFFNFLIHLFKVTKLSSAVFFHFTNSPKTTVFFLSFPSNTSLFSGGFVGVEIQIWKYCSTFFTFYYNFTKIFVGPKKYITFFSSPK